MIIALMIGRKGSSGYPNKNLIKIFGKHLCEYPLMAVKKTKMISKIFISTDCPKIRKITKKYNPIFIERAINRAIKLTDRLLICCLQSATNHFVTGDLNRKVRSRFRVIHKNIGNMRVAVISVAPSKMNASIIPSPNSKQYRITIIRIPTISSW